MGFSNGFTNPLASSGKRSGKKSKSKQLLIVYFLDSGDYENLSTLTKDKVEQVQPSS
jgi:hypothetical protein